MSRLNIMLFRKSLFYAPLLVAVEGGHLGQQGLEATLRLATPECTVRASLLDGSVDVGQGAVSQSWPLIEKGIAPGFLHFAQINCRDGFFLVGRRAGAFRWSDLAGARVLVDHGAQPLASFRYACYREGVDFTAVTALDAGGEREMLAAFIRGEGDYVHLQAPAAQQAASEGAVVLASVGEAVGPIAFTSLMATRRWLEGPAAAAFMAGMEGAMRAVRDGSLDELAALVQPHFPDAGAAALRQGLAAYRRLGTWAGPLAIPQDEYAAAHAAFAHAGIVRQRHEFDQVVMNLAVRQAA